MTIQDLKQALRIAKRMQSLSGSLTKIGERRCNEPMSEYQTRQLDKREDKILKEAEEMASLLGLEVYYQTDSRGRALYLYEPAYREKIDSVYGLVGMVC